MCILKTQRGCALQRLDDDPRAIGSIEARSNPRNERGTVSRTANPENLLPPFSLTAYFTADGATECYKKNVRKSTRREGELTRLVSHRDIDVGFAMSVRRFMMSLFAEMETSH